jgi:heme/copper-type cytochrome/quinol oxidase subunit 3
MGIYVLSFYPLFNFSALALPFTNLMVLLYSTLPGQSSLAFGKIGALVLTMESLGQLVACGVVFLTLQIMEFLYSLYALSDLFVGSIFYFTTSIHGLHVVAGCVGWIIIILIAADSLSFITKSGSSSGSSKTSTSASSTKSSGITGSISFGTSSVFGSSSPSFFTSISLSSFL